MVKYTATLHRNGSVITCPQCHTYCITKKSLDAEYYDCRGCKYVYPVPEKSLSDKDLRLSEICYSCLDTRCECLCIRFLSSGEYRVL